MLIIQRNSCKQEKLPDAVIASEAKQSRKAAKMMDCFGAYAPRNDAPEKLSGGQGHE